MALPAGRKGVNPKMVDRSGDIDFSNAPNATKTVKGIVSVGDGLSVTSGKVKVTLPVPAPEEGDTGKVLTVGSDGLEWSEVSSGGVAVLRFTDFSEAGGTFPTNPTAPTGEYTGASGYKQVMYAELPEGVTSVVVFVTAPTSVTSQSAMSYSIVFTEEIPTAGVAFSGGSGTVSCPGSTSQKTTLTVPEGAVYIAINSYTTNIETTTSGLDFIAIQNN